MSNVVSVTRGGIEPEASVVVAYLFGSEARGNARPDSDVDVAVLLAPGADATLVQLRLIAALGEVLAPRPIDVVVLNDASIAVGYRVLRDGVVLLSRDEKARIAHWVMTVDRYLDMEPMRRTLETGLRHRIEEGKFGRR